MEFPRYSYQREGEGEEMPHQFGPPPPSTRLEVRRPTQKTKKLRPLKSSIYSLSRRRRRRVDGDNIPHHLRRSIETVSEPIDLIRVARDANFRTSLPNPLTNSNIICHVASGRIDEITLIPSRNYVARVCALVNWISEECRDLTRIRDQGAIRIILGPGIDLRFGECLRLRPRRDGGGGRLLPVVLVLVLGMFEFEFSFKEVWQLGQEPVTLAEEEPPLPTVGGRLRAPFPCAAGEEHEMFLACGGQARVQSRFAKVDHGLVDRLD